MRFATITALVFAALVSAQDEPPSFPTDDISLDCIVTELCGASSSVTNSATTAVQTEASSTNSEVADATSITGGPTETGEDESRETDDENAGARPSVAVAIHALFGAGALIANL